MLIFYIILNTFLHYLGILISEFNWVIDTLMKSRHIHHNVANIFKNIEGSNQLVCTIRYIHNVLF